MKNLLLSSVLLLLCCHAEARPVHVPSLAELTSTAGYVVIIEPESVKETKDVPDDNSFRDKTMTDYTPLETTCRVLAVPKGEVASDTVQIVHFRFAGRKVDFNGSHFITFFFPPAGLATYPADQSGKPTVEFKYSAYATGKPQYLAFLRRLPDGRFAAVTPQYDAAFSFSVLTAPTSYGYGYRLHPATKPASPEQKADSDSK